ncbi:MAG: hypothetical protein AB3N16_12035 [Flavobacteriaceae bacterium]
MKKRTFLSILIVAFAFYSCSSDDNGSPGNQSTFESDILGTWNLTALEVLDGTTEVTVSGQTTTGTFTSVGKDFDATLTFTDNPKKVNYEGSYSTTLTYTLLGQSVTQEVPGENLVANSDWQIEGDTLITTESGVQTKFFIKELTNSSLKLESVFDRSDTVQGIDINFTGTLSVGMTK